VSGWWKGWHGSGTDKAEGGVDEVYDGADEIDDGRDGSWQERWSMAGIFIEAMQFESHLGR